MEIFEYIQIGLIIVYLFLLFAEKIKKVLLISLIIVQCLLSCYLGIEAYRHSQWLKEPKCYQAFGCKDIDGSDMQECLVCKNTNLDPNDCFGDDITTIKCPGRK